MQKNNENYCENVFKNDNIDKRKKELARILIEIINAQLKTGQNSY